MDGGETQESQPHEHMADEVIEDDLGDLDPADQRLEQEVNKAPVETEIGGDETPGPTHQPQEVEAETIDANDPGEDVQAEEHTTQDNDQDTIPGVRRSSRIRVKTKPDHVPTMSGTRHGHAVTQSDCQKVTWPDQHMLFQEAMTQEEPDVVVATMTQLSLKAGLKHWGTKGKAAALSEMKQLYLRDTFKPLHWKDMTSKQRSSMLESHMLLKEK